MLRGKEIVLIMLRNKTKLFKFIKGFKFKIVKKVFHSTDKLSQEIAEARLNKHERTLTQT